MSDADENEIYVTLLTESFSERVYLDNKEIESLKFSIFLKI